MERKNSNKSREVQPPSDLVDTNDPINKSSMTEKISILFDFFNKKEGDSSIIKNWSSNFHLHSLLSFCDVLSTILQLAGKRIELTVEHIESDAFDIVLDEFQEETESIKTKKSNKNSPILSKEKNKNSDSDNDAQNQNEDEDNNTTDEDNDDKSDGSESISQSQIPPISKFLKDKIMSKTLTRFWCELSEAMISCNALYDSTFINFRQWLIAFNKSKIRIIRQSSSLCALSLFNSLAVSLNRSKNELFRLTNLFSESDENKQNSMLIQSKNLYEQDVKFFTSVSLFLLQNIVFLRINDSDENIRMMAVQSLTDAVVSCPSEFADYQKLKCFEKILNDRSARNRREVLRCIQRILNESPLYKNIIKGELPENNYSNLYYYDKIKPLADKFVPIILRLFNDRDNSVVASAIDCLYSFTDNKLLAQNKQIEELCISCASSLLSDESQVIRAAAAKFFARILFGKHCNDSENNTSILRLIDFLIKHFCSNKDKSDDKTFNNEDDLQIAISSLFPNLPFLHDWDEMIDILSIEKDNTKARILAKVLLYSADKLNSNNFNISSTSSSSVDLNNQIRKLSLSLVKSLPILIKGYQNDDDIVLPLVDAARFINLDVVSENSYEHYFQKLLAEICNIFLHSSNRIVFTTSIASLYELSVRNHQLSLIARRELDRLAVECGNDRDLSEYFSDQDQSSISPESLENAIKEIVEDRESIAKFVAAARLVDVSDNGKLRSIVINRINILSKVFEQNENDFNFDAEFYNLILEVISDCIECLQFIFRWDIKHIHNKKISKDDYKKTFLDNLNIFYHFLTTTIITQSTENDQKSEETNEKSDDDNKDDKENTNDSDDTENLSQKAKDKKINASSLVKEQAFKALSDVIALSPFLREDFSDVLVDPEIVQKFYASYHTLFIRSKKVELFSYAMHPIRTRAIEMSYAAHLFVYFGFNPLQQNVKSLWKDISQGLKVVIRGTHLLNAIILASSMLNKNELRLSARFMLGKVKANDFIDQYLNFELEREKSKYEQNDDNSINDEQYEAIVASSLPFFFAITIEKAKDLLDSNTDEETTVPPKYIEVLSLIANGEKPTQKSFSQIIQASKSNQTRVVPPSNTNPKTTSKPKPSNKNKMNLENEISSSSTTSNSSDNESSTEKDDDIESE